MPTLSPEDLRRLARLGAITRLAQLRAEEDAIRAEFPELFGRGRRPEPADPAGATDWPRQGRRRRRTMSPAARKAISARMRRYWAERRKTKASK